MTFKATYIHTKQLTFNSVIFLIGLILQIHRCEFGCFHGERRKSTTVSYSEAVRTNRIYKPYFNKVT